MSLLMDALKKAEAAKRQAEAAPAAEPKPEWSIEPVEGGSARPLPPSRLPDLALHTDAVDAELAAVPKTAAAGQRPAAAGVDMEDASERTAARNLFSAKQPSERPSRPWVPIGLGAAAALAIGGYFWWQMQAIPTGTLARPTTPAAQQPAATPPRPPEPAPQAAAAAEPRPEPATLAGAPAAIAAAKPPQPAKPARLPPRASPNAAPFAGERPIQLGRSHARPDQAIERAYDDLQAGRLDEAQRGYEAVLHGDAKNTDALLGLATIAARQGRSERAQTLYQRAYETDPSNPTAQAGLLNSKGQTDAELSESRLKTALASQPDSAALHAALGNLYARQSRWAEAQQAYFNAYAGEPDNADFLVNLAISLDHLRQGRLAAQYYRMALQGAETGSASFDKNQIKNRLLELQP